MSPTSILASASTPADAIAQLSHFVLVVIEINPRLTLRDAALKLSFVTAEQFDEWVRPEDMTHPL